MIKQFPKKLIREKKYPRCHYTKKRGKLKPKKPYDSLQAAEDLIWGITNIVVPLKFIII